MPVIAVKLTEISTPYVNFRCVFPFSSTRKVGTSGKTGQTWCFRKDTHFRFSKKHQSVYFCGVNLADSVKTSAKERKLDRLQQLWLIATVGQTPTQFPQYTHLLRSKVQEKFEEAANLNAPRRKFLPTKMQSVGQPNPQSPHTMQREFPDIEFSTIACSLRGFPELTWEHFPVTSPKHSSTFRLSPVTRRLLPIAVHFVVRVCVVFVKFDITTFPCVQFRASFVFRRCIPHAF